MFLRINKFTHQYVAPEGWDESTQGVCNTVYVREEILNGVKMNCIALEFTPAEREAIDAGKPVILGISGPRMPVCFIGVGDHLDD